MSITCNNIPYGFKFGSAKVTRLASDEKSGWVDIEIKTPKQAIQIYVTKTGKIRVYGETEWKPMEKSTT